MSWISRFTGRTEDAPEIEELDPALKQALSEFKASVHAWSDAEMGRTRTVRATVVRRTWRLVAGWSLAAMLLAGTASGGIYEYHQRQLQAQAAAIREAEHQRQLAAQKALEDAQQEEDMLASVDTDVSRETPSAMDPLVQLSEDDSGTQ